MQCAGLEKEQKTIWSLHRFKNKIKSILWYTKRGVFLPKEPSKHKAEIRAIKPTLKEIYNRL